MKCVYRLGLHEITDFYLDEGGHGLDHVVRVHRMAMWIGEKLGADLEIVNAAALLHDLARSQETAGQCACHAHEGARLARGLLASLGYDDQQTNAICHCIAVHRYSRGKRAETLEAKILQDADRLDALGAICIARVFMYNGLHKTPMFDARRLPEDVYSGQRTTAVHHFYEKILKIRPETFHTEPARQVARSRYQFTAEFMRRFMVEWHGEDLKDG